MRRAVIRRRGFGVLLAGSVAAVCHAFAATATATAATAALGTPAPDFELRDTAGKTVRLSDFRGRHVVLEWTNPGCPFVRKHYGSHNLPTLQKEFVARNVVWLAVSSTAPGSTDHLPPGELAARYKAWDASPTALLMDDAGRVGRAYGAKTTPQLFVVDAEGKLVYAGGIDDKRSADPADIAGAKNYVRAALDESLAGRPVSTPAATPYGCSVKYAS